MSFHLYVGNYPTEYTRKDVADIFQDFDDIKIVKFFKKEKKCYSFLLCNDIDQVVSIIREKNNASVSGRKLIVRASDAKLQEYVELLLRETENISGYDACKTRQVTESEDSRSGEFPREKSNDESSKFVPIQVLRNKASKHQKARDTHEHFDKYSCQSPCSSVSNHHFDEHGYKYESENASSSSNYYSPSSDYQEDISELTWVSVTNFPLGTTKRCLYELFSDYYPVDVQMICNAARKDKTITEALVCFLNRDIADDVILNFDNTMFDGRILLVNDTQDLTVMNELLNGLRV